MCGLIEMAAAKRVRWNRLVANVTVWLVAEVILGMFGVDHLADYSEFIFHDRSMDALAEVVFQSRQWS